MFHEALGGWWRSLRWGYAKSWGIGCEIQRVMIFGVTAHEVDVLCCQVLHNFDGIVRS
jgi:hypothetical protein